MGMSIDHSFAQIAVHLSIDFTPRGAERQDRFSFRALTLPECCVTSVSDLRGKELLIIAWEAYGIKCRSLAPNLCEGCVVVMVVLCVCSKSFFLL
jgi:hypothetical protein